METLTKIPETNAIPLWNSYALSQSTPIPYSFNPSLYTFYQKHFNWKPYYFIIYYKEEIINLLPIVDTGNVMVSLPHFSYGGFANTKGIISKGNVIINLLSAINRDDLKPGFYKVLPRDREVSLFKNKPLFIRSIANQNDSNYIRSEKVTYWLNIKDKETVFNSLSSNLRRKIRKASKEKLEIKIGKLELLNDFYTVYSNNIYLLKSLNYSKRFFKDLLISWNNGDIFFVVVYKNSKPVACALVASFGLFYENLFFATLPNVRKFYTSDWLHWQIIKHIIKINTVVISGTNTNVVYSFGRSTEFSNVHKYKSHWPVTVKPIYIFSDISDIRQNNLLQKMWGILPQVITKPFGAKLIKYIY